MKRRTDSRMDDEELRSQVSIYKYMYLLIKYKESATLCPNHGNLLQIICMNFISAHKNFSRAFSLINKLQISILKCIMTECFYFLDQN